MKDAPPAGALDTRAKAGGATSRASGALARFTGWLTARPLAQTALALALAIAIRAYFLVQSRGMVEGDEAILGIQAERILHGARPIYMYGQAYMASWDAYLTAPLIALFGPSGTILHVVPLLESLLLVPLMGALATRMFRTERARFPAMLLAAIPPVYVGVVELHMWGGYVGTLVLGAALMLVTLRIADRWALAQPTHWLWLLAGLLTGFAWWIDPLIIYYLLACALWLILPALVRATLARARPAPGLLKGALAFTGAAVVGAFPAILYLITTPGATTPGQALPYLSGGAPSGLTGLLRLNLIGYFALLDAPRVAGIAIPWDPFTAHKALNVLVAIVPMLAALLALWAAALIVVGAARVLRLPRADQRHAVASPVWASALPVILAVVIFFVFWRSPSSVALGRQLDTVGRYAVPLTASISLLLVYAYLYLPTRAARALARLPRWDSERRRALAARVLPLALFALLLASYGAPYVMTDQAQAMESTYSLGLRFPAEHADLITYLEQRHITHVWADHWVGNVTMYLTQERIVAADYYDVMVFHSRDRFPEAMAGVAQADRPSFIVRDARGTPWAATAMTRLGVQYAQARFGDIWVITPLSRTVTPLELARAGCDITPLAFDQPSCDQLASVSA
ncbi:MAG TPA: hypothetical protein VFQ25_01745 [Ktedonobacterales bacterium]|nr:hypothetical protein [Ktedonobacterales bacterium]